MHKSRFTQPVRFRSVSHNTQSPHGTVHRKYEVSIEKQDGKVLYDSGFHKFANGAIHAAKRQISGRFDKKFSGCHAVTVERFFPCSRVEVQSILQKKLGVAATDSLASLKRKIARSKSSHRQKQGLTLSSLAEIKVLVVRKDSDGNVIKTAKTDKPSCMKVPLEKYLDGRGSKDLVLVDRDRLELEAQRLRTVTKSRGLLKSSVGAANVEKRKAVKQRKEIEQRAVFIRNLRLGKNLKHSPISTFGRIFALKVCNRGNIPDSRYQAVVAVISLQPLVSHVVFSPLLLATTGSK
jgi:hypothetical protein